METNKKITRGYETVTPEKAQKWLGTSLGNRPINSKKVMLFMQYMAANEWNRDAQPIYFDEDGHLLDGHTRLNAVIRSGATIEIEVKRNFPRAEWNKLNVATGWNAGDFAAANQVKDPNVAMAAVKIREALKRGRRLGSLGGAGVGKVAGRIWTNDDYLQLYKADADWQDDIDFAVSMWRQWHGIPASMCAGILHHLVRDCRWPRDFVHSFFHQVYTLEGITSNTRVLRKRIDLDRVTGIQFKSNYLCILISKAFEGYAMNIPKQKLQVNDMSATPAFPRRKA